MDNGETVVARTCGVDSDNEFGGGVVEERTCDVFNLDQSGGGAGRRRMKGCIDKCKGERGCNGTTRGGGTALQRMVVVLGACLLIETLCLTRY